MLQLRGGGGGWEGGGGRVTAGHSCTPESGRNVGGLGADQGYKPGEITELCVSL